MSTGISLSAFRNDTLMIVVARRINYIDPNHRKHHIVVQVCDYPTVISNGPFMDDVVDEDSIEGRVRRTEEYEDDIDQAGSLDIERLDPIRHMEVSRATPQSLFSVGIGRNAHPPVIRFIRVDDPKSLLIYTDGACLGNGQVEPRAGWAFVFGPLEPNTTASVNERLEYQGPMGDFADPTSNRAELRAIIGALRFRNWTSEGFTTLVLATDSEYVVKSFSWGGRALG
ncbi:uncharacterized protein BKA55DRAFT_662040 [Fusarium redolens]|uniref:RNase H type-1 domain-containing protein n=1 Tax=Fusarium redolens TaxID=48865 RepID=A0A9P9HL77_FUSRE|nr:uncharacterized protein BKA55DRAFT_662040 [Fusarium redolens]KAH7259396.1 hypothetical protein BKA55DRAFT_662040 [Fusarium redolens]